MQIGRAAHRPYFAVAEEPAHRQRAHRLHESIGVVVGNAVEVFSPAEAGKQQGTRRLRGRFRIGIEFEAVSEVFRG